MILSPFSNFSGRIHLGVISAKAKESGGDPSAGRQFLAVYGKTLLGLALAVCALVTLTDPARFFFGSRFPEIWPNSRRAKIDLFRAYGRQARVSGLILGTSRSGLLSPGQAGQRTGLRFFNAAVFDGTTDDYLAFYRLFSDLQSAPPREILIGVDTIGLSSNAQPAFELAANYPLSNHLDKSDIFIWHYANLYSHYFRIKAFNDLGTSVIAGISQLRRRPLPEPYYRYNPDYCAQAAIGELFRHFTSGPHSPTSAYDETLPPDSALFSTILKDRTGRTPAAAIFCELVGAAGRSLKTRSVHGLRAQHSLHFPVSQ